MAQARLVYVLAILAAAATGGIERVARRVVLCLFGAIGVGHDIGRITFDFAVLYRSGRPPRGVAGLKRGLISLAAVEHILAILSGCRKDTGRGVG